MKDVIMTKGFVPDKYQQAIKDVFLQKENHIFINAKAGAGKTTTLLYLMESVDEDVSAISLAFSKQIQMELSGKIPDEIVSMTLNGCGYQILKRAGIAKKKLKKWKTGGIISDFFKHRRTSREFREAIRQLVGLHKNTLEKDLRKLVEIYQIDFGSCDRNKALYYAPQIIELDKKMSVEKGVCDFDDQLWLPIELDLDTPTYELIFIDETQDLNTAQIELVMKLASNGGRVIAVGDPHQSIFAFRGADPSSIRTLLSKLKETDRGYEILPLSISYRCSKSVIELAQKNVPGIEYALKAPQGSVNYKDKNDFVEYLNKLKPEDLQTKDCRKIIILSRCNSPLIEWQTILKNLGLPFSFKSNLVASQLQELVAVHSNFGRASIIETWRNLITYATRVVKFIPSLLAKSAFRDKINTLLRTIDLVPVGNTRQETYENIEAAIKNTFSSNDGNEANPNTVLISTIHCAKGLEANNVFIVRPDLIPHPLAKSGLEVRQEQNMRYVAITRAKNHLYFINDDDAKLPEKDAWFER